MSYSKISRLRIKNFRNIGLVDIDFTQSPIVTLVGENEAGKTSVIKAFSMCALHDSPRDQKDYIRDGTKSLAVAIELEDGTSILRYKELNGANVYRVTPPSGDAWEMNKITDGLPVKVAQLMGLTVEPETGEYLNVRTYEDKLLFVVTPGSVNYKVMYNALKVEQLTKAIKLGSDEVNTLRSELNRSTASIETLTYQLRDIKVHDITPLTNIKDRLTKQMETLAKIEKLEEMVNKANEIEEKLGAYELINVFKLEYINEVEARILNNLNRLIDRQVDLENKENVIAEVYHLEEISTHQLEAVNSLIGKIQRLDSLESKAVDTETLNQLEIISEAQVSRLNTIGDYIKRIDTIEDNISKYNLTEANEISDTDINNVAKADKVISLINAVEVRDKTLESYENYIKQVENYLKQCGVSVETCPKCGESVIFDLDKVNT